jgi:hypothetical protein
MLRINNSNYLNQIHFTCFGVPEAKNCLSNPLTTISDRLRGTSSPGQMGFSGRHYVTHDQIEAMTLGDRIVVIKGGEIMQIGMRYHRRVEKTGGD